MNILSIQSWVAYGHVGNAAALFPLQRLGAEVVAINTVQFSNHPGHGGFTGQVFTGPMIRDLVDGIAARGVLARLDAVLSGYLGDVEIGEAVLDAVSRTRAGRPGALYCCDPVMGDRGRGLYVRPAIPGLLADRALALADILTPNHFELEQLSGAPCRSLPAVAGAAQALRRRMRTGGPRLVLVTSVETEDAPPDTLDMLLATEDGAMLLRTPRLALAANGAGDLIAGLLLLHILRGTAPVQALETAASSVWGVLRRTLEDGAREMRLVAAQDEFVLPSRIFRAMRLSQSGVPEPLLF